MKRSIAMILLFLLISNVLPLQLTKPQKLSKVDQTIQIKFENASPFNGGKFEGFGTSFCWWANRIGYSDVLSEKAAEVFYDKEKGLGLNIIRFNIGGGDNPSHTHITRTDSNMPGYWKNEKVSGDKYTWDYDWNKDNNQKNVLIKCVKKAGSEAIVEGFSNSPPYFMTNSGCSTGNTNPGKDNLKSNAVTPFAQYMADVTEYYSKEVGITFQSVTPMNEPFTNFWGANSPKQEGCHFDQGNSQSNIIVALRKALDAKGLKGVQISASDETSVGTQITSIQKLSDEAKRSITRIDTHTYQGGRPERENLRKLALSEKKNLWMSEVDGGTTEGQNSGEMGGGLFLANRMIWDLNLLRSSSWILWQVIDNHISKVGYNGRKDKGMVNVNGGFWGLAVADHDNNKIILTQKYYAMGQLTRYIRPGYTVISCDNANTVAAYDSQGKKFIFVATNNTGGKRTIDVDMSQFSKVGDNVKVIRTSGGISNGESWKELSPLETYGKGFNAELIPNSVTTYIVEGVEK